jgi:hypothetical protein
MDAPGRLNASLERALEEALEGDARCQRVFFEVLLGSTVVVPERNQARPLSDAPRYPNDLLNVLGVQHVDRVVVPVFTEADIIERWCGNRLRSRSLRFVDLLASIPDDWWIGVNPGGDVEKELSPWELSILRRGPQGIDEIVEDLTADVLDPTVRIRAPKEDEYGELKRLLLDFGERSVDVARIFLLREEGGDARGAVVLIGVEGFSSESADLERLKRETEAVAGGGLIGSDPARVLVGGRETNNFGLTIFRTVEPIYERRGGHDRSLSHSLRRTWSRFRGKFKST